MKLNLQVLLVGNIEVDTENYLEGFREENDLEEDDSVEMDALIAYTKEQLRDELQSGDSEVDEAEFISITRK